MILLDPQNAVFRRTIIEFVYLQNDMLDPKMTCLYPLLIRKMTSLNEQNDLVDPDVLKLTKVRFSIHKVMY